jgi:mannonate dehydratase
MRVKIALQIEPSEEQARFARQVGVEHVVWGGPDSPKGYLELETLLQARDFFAARGLQLGVIENVPLSFYDRAMFGLPGRDEQIGNYCRTLENMGRAGIPVMGYNWMALGGISTDQIRGRGGALERHFDLECALRAPASALDWRGPVRLGRPVHLPDIEIGAEQMWDNLVYFLERVLPAAEAAGVALAAHPDDAPIPSFLGVARILGTLDGLRRLLEVVPSPANGIDFCQGTISEMPGVDVVAAIREFGARKKIFFAHFRDTQGTVPKFTEVFMDEGDTDMLAAVEAYREVGFDGLIRADHTPWIIGDTQGLRGFSFQIGYMRGLAQAAAARARRPQKGQ